MGTFIESSPGPSSFLKFREALLIVYPTAPPINRPYIATNRLFLKMRAEIQANPNQSFRRTGYTGGSASPDVLLEHPLLLCCEDDMGVSNDEENLVLW